MYGEVSSVVMFTQFHENNTSYLQSGQGMDRIESQFKLQPSKATAWRHFTFCYLWRNTVRTAWALSFRRLVEYWLRCGLYQWKEQPGRLLEDIHAETQFCNLLHYITVQTRALLEKLTVSNRVNKFPCSYNPKFHYRLHNSLLMDHIMSQYNPFHIHILYLYQKVIRLSPCG